jgi:hypothetical protein
LPNLIATANPLKLTNEDTAMSRRIVTTQLQSTQGGPGADAYFDKVVKYIPADINAAWVLVTALIKTGDSATQPILFSVALGFGTLLTAAWTLKQTQARFKRPALTQTFIATGAFVVWVFALSDPLIQVIIPGYQALYGSLILVLYTLGVGLITPSEK